MNIFLCGQKTFGAEIFRNLLEDGHSVVGVAAPICEKEIDPLAVAASSKGVRITPAGTLRAANIPGGTDLIIAAFCHDFVGEKTRSRARFGGIGYHPSLLPRHRGRDAVEWTIRMGDAISGGTVYWLSNHCDGGDIAAQEHCFVYPNDTAKTLYRRDLYPMGVRLIRSVVRSISEGNIPRTPQPKGPETWEPSIGRQPIFKPELPQLPFDGDKTTAQLWGRKPMRSGNDG